MPTNDPARYGGSVYADAKDDPNVRYMAQIGAYIELTEYMQKKASRERADFVDTSAIFNIFQIDPHAPPNPMETFRKYREAFRYAKNSNAPGLLKYTGPVIQVLDDTQDLLATVSMFPGSDRVIGKKLPVVGKSLMAARALSNILNNVTNKVGALTPARAWKVALWGARMLQKRRSLRPSAKDAIQSAFSFSPIAAMGATNFGAGAPGTAATKFEPWMIQALQVTSQYFGVGITLGGVFGTATELPWALIKGKTEFVAGTQMTPEKWEKVQRAGKVQKLIAEGALELDPMSKYSAWLWVSAAKVGHQLAPLATYYQQADMWLAEKVFTPPAVHNPMIEDAARIEHFDITKPTPFFPSPFNEPPTIADDMEIDALTLPGAMQRAHEAGADRYDQIVGDGRDVDTLSAKELEDVENYWSAVQVEDWFSNQVMPQFLGTKQEDSGALTGEEALIFYMLDHNLPINRDYTDTELRSYFETAGKYLEDLQTEDNDLVIPADAANHYAIPITGPR